MSVRISWSLQVGDSGPCIYSSLCWAGLQPLDLPFVPVQGVSPECGPLRSSLPSIQSGGSAPLGPSLLSIQRPTDDHALLSTREWFPASRTTQPLHSDYVPPQEFPQVSVQLHHKRLASSSPCGLRAAGLCGTAWMADGRCVNFSKPARVKEN